MRDFGFGRRFESFEKEIEIQIAQLIDIVKNGPKYEYEKVRKFIKIGLRIKLYFIQMDFRRNLLKKENY